MSAPVLAFRRARPTPRATPPMVKKLVRLIESRPVAATLVEELIDRLLDEPRQKGCAR